MEKTTDPYWNGEPIKPGWWWLQFPDGPAPRYWDGTFWDRGSVFVGAEDYAANAILGPCPVPEPPVWGIEWHGTRGEIEMMSVQDLIEKLQHEPANAIVHINGVAVAAIEVQQGRFDPTQLDASGNVRFRSTPKGRQQGITFVHWVERSDGVMDHSNVWTA
jgi:hypothetical protein